MDDSRKKSIKRHPTNSFLLDTRDLSRPGVVGMTKGNSRNRIRYIGRP
jgi:hypothetical protein